MTAIMTVTPTLVPLIEDNAVILGGAADINRFPPVREYIDTFQFSATFTPDAADTEAGITAYSVINVSYTPALTGISTSFLNNAINISGNIQNVFANKQYQFKMNDGSIQVLSPYTSESFYGIIKYQADSARYVEVTYTITLAPNDGTNNVNVIPSITFIAKQTVNNDWEANRLLLKQLVLRGH